MITSLHTILTTTICQKVLSCVVCQEKKRKKRGLIDYNDISSENVPNADSYIKNISVSWTRRPVTKNQ